MKFTKYEYFVLFVCLTVISCRDSNVGTNVTSRQSISSKSAPSLSKLSIGNHPLTNNVSRKLAKQAALNFANSYHFNIDNLLAGKSSLHKNSTSEKNIKHVLVLKDSLNNQLLYLINFTNGGFTVIAGDKRANPVLAYSKYNKLPESLRDIIPGGLAVWLQSQTVAIKQLKGKTSNGAVYTNNTNTANTTSSNNSQENSRLWNRLTGVISPSYIKQNLPKPCGFGSDTCQTPVPPGGGTCTPSFTQVGPLLTTTWNQRNGYNNSAPQLNCTDPSNGHAFAGCVAVAMGQVMNYYQYPENTFDWSEIGNHGGPHVSNLLRNIGNRVDMSWGCSDDGGSGAKLKKITPAFNSYGYSGRKEKYLGTANYEDVIDELNAGRPVLFQGRTSGILFFGEGHVWVGDGYQQFVLCPGGEYLYFHMNWGWSDTFFTFNGFFGFNDFNSGNGNFNHHTHVIVNIHPM